MNTKFKAMLMAILIVVVMYGLGIGLFLFPLVLTWIVITSIGLTFIAGTAWLVEELYHYFLRRG